MTDMKWRPLNIPGLMTTIGPLLAHKREDGSWLYGLETSDKHANYNGAVHGGTLTALIDQAISLIAWNAADRRVIVTVHFDTDFISAVKPGEFVLAEAKVRHKTRSLIFMTCELKVDDRLVASGNAVMKIIPGK